MLSGLETTTIALIALILILAGFIKGVIGFGLPAISMGLLSLIMSPAQAVALLIVPNVISNVQQALVGRGLMMLFRKLWPFFLAIPAGGFFWHWLGFGQGSPIAVRLLGATLIAYALLGLLNLKFSIAPERRTIAGVISGAATGIMTIMTGVFVIPSGPFLQAAGLEKDELVQGLGITFLIASGMLAVTLWLSGTMSINTATGSFIALVPVMLAMFLGQWCRHRMPLAVFRTCFFGGMLALGLLLVVK
jgi:uncharacterized protein